MAECLCVQCHGGARTLERLLSNASILTTTLVARASAHERTASASGGR